MNELAKGRPDLDYIASIVGDNVRVLDVGCGSGTLLDSISSKRQNVRAVGIELSQEGVNECASKGFQVFQGDADSDLERSYIGAEYDWVILSHLIQYVRDPVHVIRRAVEIGRFVVVSFYNAAYWRNRTLFTLRGRMPPVPPSRCSDCDSASRMLSVRDFDAFCERLGLVVRTRSALDARGRLVGPGWLHNLLGYQAIYVLSATENGRRTSTP